MTPLLDEIKKRAAADSEETKRLGFELRDTLVDLLWLLAQLEAAQKVVEAARVIFPPDHVGRKTWSKEGRAVADALAEYDAAKRAAAKERKRK